MSNKLPSTFGGRLAFLRKSKINPDTGKPITQRTVSETIGCSIKTYRDWELDKKYPRYVDQVTTLADYFGCTVDFLLCRTDFRTIHGDEIHDLTGLSDEAIAVLQAYGRPDNPMLYRIAGDVSRLLVDWKENTDSLLSAVSKYARCPVDRRAQVIPYGSAFAPLGAIDADMSTILLYGIVEAAGRYSNDFQKEIDTVRAD